MLFVIFMSKKFPQLFTNNGPEIVDVFLNSGSMIIFTYPKTVTPKMAVILLENTAAMYETFREVFYVEAKFVFLTMRMVPTCALFPRTLYMNPRYEFMTTGIKKEFIFKLSIGMGAIFKI